MIPRAIAMIFRETEALKELGWQYAMTGQFVEIYNEKVRCWLFAVLAVSLTSLPFSNRSTISSATIPSIRQNMKYDMRGLPPQ
jgi:hypothetical protein